ncbi:hypothetical protein [Clostridium sp. BJN0013]|uniref:hypothetical protein n=1 Tax=Clostridium sp. BJN0013 TaxID=3236840 RepID=UPI0034C63ADF
MRDGIRKKLTDSIPELKKCCEPNVPTKDTPKPYAVVLQGDDTDNGEVVGFKRTIEVWLYEERTTFKNLDSLSDKVIKALDMQVIEDSKTNETFTCIFDGTIGQDTVDLEWDAIARGLRFNVIALHEESESYIDPWIEAVSNYINTIIDFPVYPNYWIKNFAVPSVLCRVLKSDLSPATLGANRVMKTIRCHFVSRDKSMANKFIDAVESQLIQDTKIPLDIADRRYLTISSIREDREADPFTMGQLSVDLFRLENIKKKNIPVMNKIYGRGSIKTS